jgi:hypothetical protein
MQQNEIYNIPLPRGPGPKNKTQKKGNESVLIQALAYLRIAPVAFPLYSPYTKYISPYSSIEYSAIVKDCSLRRRRIKDRSN